jgi:hypothetical protein
LASETSLTCPPTRLKLLKALPNPNINFDADQWLAVPERGTHASRKAFSEAAKLLEIA